MHADSEVHCNYELCSLILSHVLEFKRALMGSEAFPVKLLVTLRFASQFIAFLRRVTLHLKGLP